MEHIRLSETGDSVVILDQSLEHLTNGHRLHLSGGFFLNVDAGKNRENDKQCCDNKGEVLETNHLNLAGIASAK